MKPTIHDKVLKGALSRAGEWISFDDLMRASKIKARHLQIEAFRAIADLRASGRIEQQAWDNHIVYKVVQ